jgi:hypothetical protein
MAGEDYANVVIEGQIFFKDIAIATMVLIGPAVFVYETFKPDVLGRDFPMFAMVALGIFFG